MNINQTLKRRSKIVSLALMSLGAAWSNNASAQTLASEAQPAAATIVTPVAPPAALPIVPAIVPPVQRSVPMSVPVLFAPSVAAGVTPSNDVVAQSPETLSARTLTRLDQLTRELSETIGRVEALEAAAVVAKAENLRLVALVDAARAKAIEAASSQPVAPAPTAVAAPATSDAKVSETADTALFTTPQPPPVTAVIMLANAQLALQTGAYPAAEANLAQLIWVYPSSPEASEGRWLLGEARYVQSAWGTAALAYVDYLKVTPQGPRSAEALLRLAGAFRQLGDTRQRCVALAEFKRRAPRPDATLKARADSEIARMTCPTA